MSRAVRPTTREEIGELSDEALDAYIAEAKRRMAAMTKSALRNDYRKQVLAAQQIKGLR